MNLGTNSVKDGKYKGAHRETRGKILGLLKMRGDLSSSLLAEAFGVSAMAVRQHLRELVMDLFDELRESLGPDDFGAMLIKRGETQVELYRDRIDRSLSMEEQVQA